MSAEELGIDAKLLLAEQRNGIFILPPDTPIGVDIKKILGLDDVVLDIDLTATAVIVQISLVWHVKLLLFWVRNSECQI